MLDLTFNLFKQARTTPLSKVRRGESNEYSVPTISTGESSPLSSFESAEVKRPFLSENCLTLNQATEMVEKFLGQPSIME